MSHVLNANSSCVCISLIAFSDEHHLSLARHHRSQTGNSASSYVCLKNCELLIYTQSVSSKRPLTPLALVQAAQYMYLLERHCISSASMEMDFHTFNSWEPSYINSDRWLLLPEVFGVLLSQHSVTQNEKIRWSWSTLRHPVPECLQYLATSDIPKKTNWHL